MMDLYFQRQSSPVTPISDNVIREYSGEPRPRGFPGKGASNDVGVIENMDFQSFRLYYVFGTLRNDANGVTH